MAAMGATPRWATLAIALPEANEAWLEKFSAGFFALAQQYGVDLVGGDTTRGPLNLCVTIFGEVPAQQALRRNGAQLGDEVWVSGKLGDAALALAHLQGRIMLSEYRIRRLCARFASAPAARLAGIGVTRYRQQRDRYFRRAARRSRPHSRCVADWLRGSIFRHCRSPRSLRGHLQQPLGKQCALSGGDDYELCFTAPAARHAEILDIATRLKLPLTHIGTIVAGLGCLVLDAAGDPINIEDYWL